MVTREILNSHPISTLKKEVSKYNKLNVVSGYSKMKKSEIVELMMKHQDKFKHIKMNEKAQRTSRAGKTSKEDKKAEKKEEPKKEVKKPKKNVIKVVKKAKPPAKSSTPKSEKKDVKKVPFNKSILMGENDLRKFSVVQIDELADYAKNKADKEGLEKIHGNINAAINFYNYRATANGGEFYRPIINSGNLDRFIIYRNKLKKLGEFIEKKVDVPKINYDAEKIKNAIEFQKKISEQLRKGVDVIRGSLEEKKQEEPKKKPKLTAETKKERRKREQKMIKDIKKKNKEFERKQKEILEKAKKKEEEKKKRNEKARKKREENTLKLEEAKGETLKKLEKIFDDIEKIFTTDPIRLIQKKTKSEILKSIKSKNKDISSIKIEIYTRATGDKSGRILEVYVQNKNFKFFTFEKVYPYQSKEYFKVNYQFRLLKSLVNQVKRLSDGIPKNRQKNLDKVFLNKKIMKESSDEVKKFLKVGQSPQNQKIIDSFKNNLTSDIV